jgi:phospholipase/carboxylesterase
MMDLDGPRFGPAAGGAAEQLVVFLHGWGADGNDLISLAPILAQHLPQAAFVSPHAPFPCEVNPMGRQWFSLLDRNPQNMLAGLGAVVPLVNAFLDEELSRLELGPENLALVGFSQGTMTALHIALRRTPALAAVAGFSGALLAPEKLPAEIKSRPPVLLVHGQTDQVVPFGSLAAAKMGLEAADVSVETLARPGLGHGIDEAGLAAALKLLTTVFGAGKS